MDKIGGFRGSRVRVSGLVKGSGLIDYIGLYKDCRGFGDILHQQKKNRMGVPVDTNIKGDLSENHRRP